MAMTETETERAARIEAEWRVKQALSDRAIALLGTHVPSPSRVAKTEAILGYLRPRHGKWALKIEGWGAEGREYLWQAGATHGVPADRAHTWDTQAEALDSIPAWKPRSGKVPVPVLLDFAAEIETEERNLDRLKTVGIKVTWQLCVWHKAGDKRVYIRPTWADRQDRTDVEYHYTGSSQYRPGTLTLSPLMRTRFADPARRTELIDFLADTCRTWHSIDIACDV